ncbi:hypothetical protein V8F20_009615 [Naviculisporaceae sp. PSN 640]
MSVALSKAAPLKAEIRLAQAVSQFEADLSSDQKAEFRCQKSNTYNSPPSAQDVMYLTAKIDWETSRRTGGGGRCFGPRFTNVLQAVQQFAALGDVIIGGSQNIIACGVWTLVRMTLLSLVNYSSYMEKLSTLLMVAGRSAPRYQKMALVYPKSRILQSHLSEYFIVVVQLCHHMFKIAKRTVIGQLVSSLSDQELKDHENSLIRWSAAIKEETDLLLSENIDDQGTRVKILLKMSESEAYRRKFKIHCHILDSCSIYDYETTWKEIRKAGNTALLSSITEYATWKNNVLSSTLLWRGKLGAGKSVLLANVVDDLNLHASISQTPVAYFFCRHDDIESLKARTVIGSLARQLLRSLPLLTTHTTIDETVPYLNCDHILTALRKTLPSSFRAYFVLDGLDECDEKERLAILENVRALQQMFVFLACLSFRVDASSTQWWLPSMVINPEMVSIPDENPDIACFISSELESNIRSGKLKVGDPAIVLEIEDALLQGSQGMFLWVALQIESLCLSKTDHAIREALADLPKDLPETFARIIQRSGESGKDYQVRIFNLLLAAFRPLTVEELREALSVVPGNTTWNPAHSLNDMYSVLACCGGLISINEETLTVKLIHHSVKQFLLGEARLSQARLFTLDRARHTMREIIITYLNYCVFDTSLSKTVMPEINAEASPSKIVKSINTISSVQALALKYLQSRKQPGYNMGRILAGAAPRREPDHKTQFHFHSYATSYWLDHVMLLPITEQATINLVVALIMSHSSSDYTGHAINGYQHLLSWAAEQGHEEMVRALLGKGADIEVRDRSGMTPLCLAVLGGHENIVRLLVDGGANIETKSNIGLTPLFLAVRDKKHAIVSVLMLHGANPDVSLQHPEIFIMMHEAFKTCSHDKPLRKSLRGRFVTGDTDNGDQVTSQATHASALTLAIVAEDESMVWLLLQHRKRQSLESGSVYDLEYAVICGNSVLVKMILEVGYYRMPRRNLLLIAIKNRDLCMVDTLLEHFPGGKELLLKITETEGRTQTALKLAVRGGQADIVRTLLNNGADPNLSTNTQTPLTLAASKDDRYIVDILSQNGADVNLQNLIGRTALSYAAENGNTCMIESLASSQSFDPKQCDIPDIRGYTPLAYAIISQSPYAVQTLLDLGASPNIKDNSHSTNGRPARSPLETAILFGPLGIVMLLVENGARMAPPGTGMETPLASQLARDEGLDEVARCLERMGL